MTKENEELSNQPLVTIVTITFNLKKAGREETFRQCVESVRNQTYKNIEHIVVDGASKDGTVDLIKEYTDKGWITYVSKPDTGIYDAMNNGVKMANGKYVTFLNSDDYYHSSRGVEASVKALEESGADFSYAPAIMMREDGSLYNDHPHVSPKISTVFFVMPFCHQTMLTKRSVMEKEDMFDENFKSAGDYEFVIRLCLKKYKCIQVNDAFVTFRWGGFSVSSNELSINEVTDAYYKNYSKLCPITREECSKIYCIGYSNIPFKLAKKLKNLRPYFDYDKYLDSNRLIEKLKSSKWFSKIEFALFSPRKFFKKYLNNFLNGPFRQPARKTWYAIRGKKLLF
jgi:glycosyltransferase involved in cell wall biosynthesis